VRATVRSYRESMIRFADMRNLDVWYAKVDEERLRAMAAGKRGPPRCSTAL
ncbi:DUF2252 domain-containing protein, partial [Streptomyces sp. FT05W]